MYKNPDMPLANIQIFETFPKILAKFYLAEQFAPYRIGSVPLISSYLAGKYNFNNTFYIILDADDESLVTIRFFQSLELAS